MTGAEINEAVASRLGWTYFQPDYCHDIKEAWEAVEVVAKEAERKGGGPLINICYDGQWHVSIGVIVVQADTAPMAICLAFLRLPE